MASTPNHYILPDLISLLPFEGSLNPHYEQAAEASSVWLHSYGIGVVPEHKRAFFQQKGSELLCAYAYPYAGYDELRTTMDFINLLYVVDELSDDQGGEDAWKTGRVLLNIFHDPNWDDGSRFAQMSKEVRNRLLRVDVPACDRRLVKLCEDYVNAISLEAELRERNEVPDMEAFIALRRENSGVPFCIGAVGCALRLDLPDKIFEHPLMRRLHHAAADMVALSNDIYSYSREQALGLSGNNILTVLMNSEHCDLQTAADRAGLRFKQLMEGFQADKACLPSWGPDMDTVVGKFVMALETWVVGNCKWSFETHRYFGIERDEVKRTRVVKLYPRREM
ncbi:terpenoid synthase [Daedalea quercina L-15889]|uniref:Terpene synthase n=1 Tax=Daedalea quercina L-15889 TaxID=1314783 RepID=A0A165QEQ2_9APHY|nr:terpenoid synthase [Daedalea quercina L-15889]